MSYIRTKDGRIIDTSKIATGSKYMDFATNDESFRKIFKTESLSKSENLEELCDCIIETKGHTGDYFHYTYTAFDEPSKERLLDDMINQDFEVYYAIWTSKGLIYVAKMNENGVLELI